MDAIFNGITFIGDWLNNAPSFIESVFIQLMSWVVIFFIHLKIYALHFAWSVAKQVLVNANITSLIHDSWAQLDSNLLGHLSFFKAIEAVNILFQALVTKFTIRLIGL